MGKPHSLLLSPPRMGPLNLLVLQPTSFCNFACKYCYLTMESRSTKKKMTLKVIEQTLKNLFQSKIPHNKFTVVWHAGEPLTVGIKYYEAAFQLIDSLRPEGCDISHSFQTNGSLIDDAWCEFLKKWNVKLGLSIDGPERIHDHNRVDKRGHGTHKQVMDAIEVMKRNKLKFSTISVVTRETIQNPHDFIDFFIENNILDIGFNIEEIEGFNDKSSLDVSNDFAQYLNFLKIVHDKSRFVPGMRVREIDSTQKVLLQGKGRKMARQAVPMTLITVAVNGDYSTFSPELLDAKSETFGDFVFGNVSHDSFDEIWRNPFFQQVYSDIQSGIRKCHKTCDYAFACGGGGPSNKFFENGTFDSTETLHCLYTKKAVIQTVATQLARQEKI